MGVWDLYEQRVAAQGSTRRDTILKRESDFLRRKMKGSLSYHEAVVDGVNREVSIIDSDNLNEKMMFSMPGEDFDCGGMVDWADNHWIITEKDANNELRAKVKILQCNYLLKWVDETGTIHEQWCVIEDGTKYLVGEYEDRNFIVTRGDARIAMTISRNKHTVNFGRHNRFIIDEPESLERNAFLLTKPLKVGKTYGGKGVYSFVLQEVVTTDDDNIELGIADYYKYFPREETQNVSEENTSNEEGKKVWI